MGGFYQDNKVVADAEVIAVTGSTGTTVARDLATAQSGTNNTLNTGGVAIGGSGNNLTNANLTVGYDAGQFQTAVQSVGSNLTNALSVQSAATQAALQKILDKQTDTDAPEAETPAEETPAAAAADSKLKWWMGGAVLLLVLAFWNSD